jgi:hypothetical protein
MKCVECNALVVGRSDKKFCSPYCKSNFHNKKKKQEVPEIQSINQILKRNRAVLKASYVSPVMEHEKSSLLKMGFKFNFFTQQIQDDNNFVYRFCYDYGYQLMENQHVKVIMLRNFNNKK